MQSIPFIVMFFLLFPSFAMTRQSNWKIPGNAPLLTRWSTEVNPAHPLPEYPRPQLVRSHWLNLNGVWEFAEAVEQEPPPFRKQLAGRILVPYPVESALSGVMRRIDRLWYRRTFTIPAAWTGQRVMLHFGAVDWEASVYVNGRAIGSHRGGYDPFSFDITDALGKRGDQEILVGVFDPSDAGDQPRGKQVLKPEGIWYTSTTGIWQTVWLEPVPEVHIVALQVVPDISSSQFRISADLAGEANDVRVSADLMLNGAVLSSATGSPGKEFSLTVPSPVLWSPGNPHLYDVRIRAVRQGVVLDSVDSYAGLRSVEVSKDEQGLNRIFLNGEPVFQIGLLDQGFWPDGIYTAPTDAALRYDIEVTKQLGFNMARKHVKVEPDRWYYWADKLGLLVWQDMPSANNKTPEGQRQFESELGEMVRTLRNHPSIVMWVVFNEGWGQFDTERLAALVKGLDPKRLVNSVSGWTDKGVGDVNDIHSYPKPQSPPAESARVAILGEFGGLGFAVAGHTWQSEHWGYQGMNSTEQLTAKYELFLRRVYGLKENPGLSAAVYTQTTDVEVECNGLVTYNRVVVKPDMQRIALANRGDFSIAAPLSTLHVVVPTSQEQAQTWRYSVEPPPESWINGSFDDSAWKMGPAGFGSRGIRGGSMRTEWTGSDLWIRRTFEMDDPGSDSLAFLLHNDGDVEVYINGTLAASATGWATEYDVFEIGHTARLAFRKGTNVIAAHCKKTGYGQYVDVGIVRVVQSVKK